MGKKPREEIWKKIPGFEAYEISNWGRLKLKSKIDDNLRPHAKGTRGIRVDGNVRKRKPRIREKGGNVSLRRDGKDFWFKMSQLVLLAFVGPPPAVSMNNARHLDDNTAHNWITNLAWGTHKQNHEDGVRNGRHAIKGTRAARRYGASFVGKARSEAVKRKISKTKRAFPARQYVNGARDPGTGRFTGKLS